VPNTLVAYFTGRDNVLHDLSVTLEKNTSRGPRMAVLHGLGGQGKTQVALRYCERYRQCPGRPTDVFWIDASSSSSLESSLEPLYRLLEGERAKL
jgi:hypothetical protein